MLCTDIAVAKLLYLHTKILSVVLTSQEDYSSAIFMSGANAYVVVV